MAWITLTEADVLRTLAGPELQALKTAALAAGQDSPLPGVILDAANEVRGYIAANRANRLGPAGTISDKLRSAALAMVRYRLADRLPVKSLLTQTRIDENNDAIKLLRDVAAARFVVDEPDVIDTTDRVPSPSPSITPRVLTFTRCDQDGI